MTMKHVGDTTYEEYYRDKVHGFWRVAYMDSYWRVDFAPLIGTPPPTDDDHNTIGFMAADIVNDHGSFAYAENCVWSGGSIEGFAVVFIKQGHDIVYEAADSTRH